MMYYLQIMSKNLKTILLIGIPLLILVVVATFLLVNNSDDSDTSETGEDGITIKEGEDDEKDEVSSDIIDKLAQDLEAECQDYVNVDRYSSVYSVCEKDDLRFRVDDLSASTDEQMGRFEAAMQLNCIADLSGSVLDISVVKGDEMVISSYLLGDPSQSVDFVGLHEQLTSAEHQAEVAEICTLVSVDLQGLEVNPIADSSLSILVEALALAGTTGCEELTFKIAQFGIESTTCDNGTPEELTDDISLTDFTDASQAILDARADSLEFTACNESILRGAIKVNDNIYATGDSNRMKELHNQLTQAEGFENIELLAFCGNR